jgi:hypothetical protein
MYPSGFIALRIFKEINIIHLCKLKIIKRLSSNRTKLQAINLFMYNCHWCNFYVGKGA